jgi:hypothetical protein
MSRSDQRRGAIWAASWGIGGPDLARAAAAAGAAGGRARRRRSTGERRCKGHMALGCTVCCGSFTNTSSTRVRTQQGHPVAAATTRSGAQRTAAAAALRRRRHGDTMHRSASRRHHRVPYLAVKLRSCSNATGRRRRRGPSTAARTETTARRGPRVWAALGFWEPTRGCRTTFIGGEETPRGVGPRSRTGARDGSSGSGSGPAPSPSPTRGRG